MSLRPPVTPNQAGALGRERGGDQGEHLITMPAAVRPCSIRKTTSSVGVCPSRHRTEATVNLACREGTFADSRTVAHAAAEYETRRYVKT